MNERGHGRALRRGFAIAILVLAASGLAIEFLVLAPAGRERRRQEAAVLNARGERALRADSLELAERLFEQALDRDARFIDPRINLAALLRRQGERERATQLLVDVLRRQGRDSTVVARVSAGLAAIEMESGRPANAIARLRTAIDYDPDREEYVVALGSTLLRAGRPAEAWQTLAPALRHSADHPALLAAAGLALVRLGRASEAAVMLDRAVRLDPDLASAYGARAVARAALQDRAGAAADWERYEDLRPDAVEHAELRKELEQRGVIDPGP